MAAGAAVVGARCGNAVDGGKTDRHGLLRTNTDSSCRQAANWQYAVCCLSSNVRLCPLRRKARQLPQADPFSLCYAVASNIARKGRVLQGEQERDPASLHYAVTSRTGGAVKVQTPAGGPGFAMQRRGGQYCVQLASFTRKEPRECTFVLDRGERRSKARQMPQDCSPYMTMMPKTKANKATVSTIPQMVR